MIQSLPNFTNFAVSTFELYAISELPLIIKKSDDVFKTSSTFS
jgi:hypothetical protein